MISNKVHFKSRSVMALLLAVLMMTLAATPALAWVEEGDINGKPALPCRIITDEAGEPTVYCFKMMPQHHNRAVVEQPLLHPAVARAEQMSVLVPQLVQVSDQ